MTDREKAIKTLKENYCTMCAYGSQDMDSCDIRSCDNKDAIKALEHELCDDAVNRKSVQETITDSLGRGQNMHQLWQKIEDLPPVTPQQRWIPVERELPELNRPLLVTAYHRVCYAHMISKSGNYGYPVFRLHELKDSARGWVQETISHEYSMGRIDAWMYIDIPQPYVPEINVGKMGGDPV